MEQDIKQQIENFYNNKNNDNLIRKYSTETIFDVLGKSRSESAHSNFLKWFFLRREWNEESLRQFIKIYSYNAIMQNKIDTLASTKSIDIKDIDMILDNCKIRIYDVSTEKTCYVRVGNTTKSGRIDLVITATLKYQSQVVPVKIVFENKIDSSEHDSQTKRYYTYFANSDVYKDEQIFHLTGKRNGHYIYRFRGDEYNGADIAAEDEKILYVYLSPENSHGKNDSESKNDSDNICEHFIKISYQDLYDNIFKGLRKEILEGKYTERNAAYFNQYASNLLRPTINQTQNHTSMCYEEQDAEKLREFFYSNLTLFRLASETVFRTSTDEGERKAVSEIYKGISDLTKNYDKYSNNRINNQTMSNSDEIPSLEEYLNEEDAREKAMIDDEIAKVKRRIPRWIKKPAQINSQILQLFMELSQNNEIPVKRDELQKDFEKDYADPFYINYVQMKNFGPNNHAKVFEEDGWGNIELWKPVADFIVGLYESKQQ